MIKLVVGLGNPGKKYEKTRHNVGYRVLDTLAPKSLNVQLFRSEEFMNSVGGDVERTVRKKGYQWQEVLVVCDDFTIPIPKLRIRLKGSSGGHNGLDSILQAAGTLDIPRLRAGIGPVPIDMDPANFVLETFQKKELATVDHLIARASEAVECAIRFDLTTAMNRYNVEPA